MEFRKVRFDYIEDKVHATVFINEVRVAELVFKVLQDGMCVRERNNQVYFECSDKSFMAAIELAAMRFVRGQTC